MLAMSPVRTSTFDRQVTAYMHRPVVARPETPVAELLRLLELTSTIAIVDELESIVGVVSRVDVIALGASSGRRTGSALPLPPRVAADIMTTSVVTIPCTATIRAAAQALAAHAIHHVFVTDRRLLMGIVGATDIVAAVRDARVSAELSTIMTTPPIMIGVGTELGAAIDLLSRVRVGGLVVVDGENPVGTFTHLDAIAARTASRTSPIEDFFEPAVLCLPASTPIHAVAGQLVRMNTQRVVACTAREVVGIATTLDFARYVAW